MSRDEIALAIFLKRLPVEPLTDKNHNWYKSCVESAYEAADLFMSVGLPKPVDVHERMPTEDE